MNCDPKPAASLDRTTKFTKADSLTEFYLALQDSLHLAWNIMIKNDNEKIEAMHNLLHELMVSHPQAVDEYKIFEDRLSQLTRMRYTPKSMSNSDVIDEYDFASNSLITELMNNAQKKREYSYNKTLQQLAENIRKADEEKLHLRIEYDTIVQRYNLFIEENREFLKQTDATLNTEKKPLFHIVSEEKNF